MRRREKNNGKTGEKTMERSREKDKGRNNWIMEETTRNIREEAWGR
jgi:hypothetical protein